MSSPNDIEVADAMQLWDIPGGIHPPEHKAQSCTLPIQSVPLPKRLIVPLNQHIGAPAEPCVVVGEQVRKGQLIATANGALSVAVHAPTSGTVSAIGPQPYPHVSALPAPAIVIDSDGLEQWTELSPCADFRTLTTSALLEKIRAAGINGLGGAGFPTAVKLSPRDAQPTHTLIINGSECEPYITADDLLMRERAAELVSGIDILVHLLQPDTVLIGIEDNKPEAIAAVRAALAERPYRLQVIPTKYPSGGEKQLIQILTGREVPSGGLPADIGLLCQNVGTCVAIHDAVVHGRPLISRITTLTGAALTQPMNVEALIGTPVGELLACAGLQTEQLDRLLLGGPMMGVALPSLEVPLIKTSNCLLASTRTELPPAPPALPCIRCGECAEVCPASLLPQQLHFFALGQQHEQLQRHHLFDCIECGACAYVCPSNIPLVQYYRAAKAEIRELQDKQSKAALSKQRFEQRQERLRREEEHREAERQARHARAAQAKAAPSASPAVDRSSSATDASEQLKRLKIEASMTQVALKKAEKQLAIHATAELQQQVATLQTAAAVAQSALAAAQASAGPSAPTTVDNPGLAALKKAKIELAMQRAALKKAELAGAEDVILAPLRAALQAAETALHVAEANSGKVAPDLVRTDKSGVDERTRTLKTELAFARADLHKLQRLGDCPADQLTQAEQRVAQAEQQLHEHSAS